MVAGQQIGKLISEALSLPKYCRSIEIRIAIDEAVSIKCEYFPELPDGGRELVAVLTEYELHEKENQCLT